MLTRRFVGRLLGALSGFGIAAGISVIGGLSACGNTVKVDVEDDNTTGTGFIDDEPSETEVQPLDPNSTCLTESGAAERRKVALHVMLDSSASMLEPAGSTTVAGESSGNKWQAVQRALRSFIINSGDTDLSFGLQFFPLPKPGAAFTCNSHADCGRDGGPCFLSTCSGGTTITLCRNDSECPLGEDCVDFGLCENSDPVAPLACLLGSGNCDNGLGRCQDFDRTCTNATDCNAARYAATAVEIGPISDAYDAVDQALFDKIPEGLTPSGPALQGAIDHARDWAAMHPDYTVVTLFVTDGLPTECGPVPGELPSIESVTAIAAAALNNEIPIQTFVVGVFQPGDGLSINNVNAIARAGGTGEAVFIDATGAVDQQFLDALVAIRSGTLACQLQLPATEELLDYGQVNLRFDDGNSVTQLTGVENAAGCAAKPNSWHYDVNPTMTAKPSSIQVCPAVCDQFKQASEGSIQLQLGCATIIQ